MVCVRVFLLIVLGFVAGCGGSSATTTTANQDELQKWVAENPVTEESDPSQIEGAVE